MSQTRGVVIAGLAACLTVLCALPATAALISSTNYRINPHAVTGGGDTPTSANYNSIGTAGQAVHDTAASATFTSGAGYQHQRWALAAPPANAIPLAFAPADSIVAQSDTVILNGTTSGDSDGGAVLAYLWSADSVSVSIAAATDSFTTATFTAPGYFTLTLAVTDGQDTGTDTMVVDVTSALLGDLTSVGGSLGQVDAADWAVFSLQASQFWNGAPSDTRCDLNADGPLDFEDVARFATQMGATQ